MNIRVKTGIQDGAEISNTIVWECNFRTKPGRYFSDMPFQFMYFLFFFILKPCKTIPALV